jgi:hypothetical protein
MADTFKAEHLRAALAGPVDDLLHGGGVAAFFA